MAGSPARTKYAKDIVRIKSNNAIFCGTTHLCQNTGAIIQTPMRKRACALPRAQYVEMRRDQPPHSALPNHTMKKKKKDNNNRKRKRQTELTPERVNVRVREESRKRTNPAHTGCANGGL